MTMRRRRAWADLRIPGTTLAASSTLKYDLLAGLTAMDTKTVTRIILDLTVCPPVTNALNVDRTSVVDVGIGVVSQEAYDLETLPDMDNTADYPQQGWIYVATGLVYKIADSGGPMWMHFARFEADLRAQRKVDRGVLFMSLLNIGINGADNIDFYGRVRVLCLT